jgi:hypothetical protein
MDYTQMDLGFVILCPDKDARALRVTARSIQHFSSRNAITVVGNNTGPHDIKKLKEWTENVYKGKNTITSLINTGMKRIKNDWAIILFAGTQIRPLLERKITRFVTSDKDIVYPIVADKYHFHNGSCNGLLINRHTFKEVGNLPDMTMKKDGFNEFEISKLFWSEDAIDKGCRFKGVVGLRIA